MKSKYLSQLIKQIADSPELPNLVRNIYRVWNSESMDFSERSGLDPQNNRHHISDTDEYILKSHSSPSVSKPFDTQQITLPDYFEPLDNLHQLFVETNNHPALLSLFDSKADDHTSFLKFIIRLSKWDTVKEIWDCAATYCKEEHSPPPTIYINLLVNSVDCYNLDYSEKKASIKWPQKGEQFDYKKHHQLVGDGKNISEVLLPTLYSATGEIIKQALVIT